MANGYFRLGIQNKQACFHHFFRKAPFNGTLVIAAGIENVLEYVANFRFSIEDVAFLSSLTSPAGTKLFDAAFLKYLSSLRLEVEVDAVKEGQAVFAREPILRVRGPLLQCQLLETAFLNIVNFQSLVATKAARCVWAAKGREVIEFGLRRAQGPDGALSATRASFVGGCSSTSNVLAAKEYKIPVKGTMAHAWVMAFEDEKAAFRAFAQMIPDNAVFLVDTYHTIEGVRNAIEVGLELKTKGHKLLGIRIDSGDFAALSAKARAMLDAAGLSETRIMVSGDLDEYRIESLLNEGAPIDMFGVGTRLSTAFEEPALGGVYKMSSVEGADCLKISDDPEKTTLPGVLQTRRYRKDGHFVSDLIFGAEEKEPQSQFNFAENTPFEDLLLPVFSKGERILEPRTLQEIQAETKKTIASIHEKHLVLEQAKEYQVLLSTSLDEKQRNIIQRMSA